MMKSRIKLPRAFPLLIVSVVFLGSFGGEAWAICTNKCQSGWDACNAWCADHNKTTNSQSKCLLKCAAYWDSGKNPQSLTVDPGNPNKPPNYTPKPVTPLPAHQG